jgi:uncharacterized repeat protein (TIGR02543 family)
MDFGNVVNMKPFAKNRAVGIATTLILFLSLNMNKPAFASGSYDPSSGSGTVSCSVSGFFTISSFSITSNSSCTGEARIPEGVASVGVNAFRNASGLSSLFLSKTILSIGSDGLRNTPALRQISIPEDSSLTTIGDSAFYGSGITSISIPASVTTIAFQAFIYTYDLVSVTFADNSNLVSLGGAAFQESGLNSIILPNKLESIGSEAFRSAPSLSSVVIPASVSFIGGNAFTNLGTRSSFNFFFLGNVPSSVEIPFFSTLPGGAQGVAFVKSSATGFGEGVGSSWSGLFVTLGVYDVTFDTNGGSAIDADYFMSGRAIALPEIPTKSGYSFLGWSVINGGQVVEFPYSPSVNVNLTLFAKWIANTYVVSFESGGGSAVSQGAFSTGGSIEEPISPNRAGFTFVGWSIENAGEVIDFPHAPSVNADLTLFAIWTPNVYSLTYVYNSATGGNSTSSASFTTGGTPIRLPTPTRTGYTFAGWYSDAGLTSKIGDAGGDYSPTDSTLTLNAYAKWTRNNIKAVSTVKPTITGTAKVSKTLTAKKGTWAGYPTPTFSYQWYVCSSSISTPESVVPTSCKKIAGATKSTFKLTSAQKGKRVSVLVTGTSSGTTKTSWLAKSTGKVS